MLIDKLSELAVNEEADAYVFVSSKQNDMEKYKRTRAYREMKLSGQFISTDLNENPLPVGTKVEILNKMYPSSGVTFVDTTVEACPQLFNVVDALRSAGYEDITMGVGSDRVVTFQKVFKDSLKVVSLGERTVNASNMTAKAMSGTKMREAAVSGNKEAFLSGVMIGDMTREDGIRLMNMIRLSLDYQAIVEGGKTRKIKIKHRRRPKTYRLRDDEKFEI